MSTTGNEFAEPGANYPDSAKETSPEERSDAGVGGAIAHEENDRGEPASQTAHTTQADRTAQTQDGPALAQNTTTDDERLQGVVQQVRADVGGENQAMVEQALRRRLNDVGLVLEEDEITALARDLSGD